VRDPFGGLTDDWLGEEEVVTSGHHQGGRDDPRQRTGCVMTQVRLDRGDVVRWVAGFSHQALAEELHQALAEPPEVHLIGDVGLSLGGPALGGLVASRSQQRPGVLPKPAAGIAQDQPADQLAVIGRQVLGDLAPAREADDVDRAGGLLTLYGVVLTVMGLFASHETKAKAAGININLWAGLVILAGGAIFLAWARLRPLRAEDLQGTDTDRPKTE
jgi:hypothetical protein